MKNQGSPVISTYTKQVKEGHAKVGQGVASVGGVVWKTLAGLLVFALTVWIVLVTPALSNFLGSFIGF